eukprot:scaffold11051_cov165-Amphora_coffeaeformis.AAC.8
MHGHRKLSPGKTLTTRPCHIGSTCGWQRHTKSYCSVLVTPSMKSLPTATKSTPQALCCEVCYFLWFLPEILQCDRMSPPC